MRRILLTCFLLLSLTHATAAAASPVGKVAYRWQEKLWVYDLATGARRPLLGAAVEEPRWSPSGHYLMLKTGLRSWLIRSADGDLQRPLTTAESEPAWAPHADKLAYWAVGGELRIESPMGEEVRQVKGATPHHFMPPLWSPTGDYLAYVEERGELPNRRAQVLRVAAGGGQPQTLLAEPFRCVGLAGWPTSASLLLWPQNVCSSSIAADGLELFRLTVAKGALRSLGVMTLLHPPAIAPNGDVAVTAGVGRFTWRDKQIVLIKASGQVTPPISPKGQAAIQPAWSPDGRHLAWSGMPEPPETTKWQEAVRSRRLWVAPLTGGPSRQVTNDPAFQDEGPVWTADGRHLLFARLDKAGAPSLYLLDLDSQEPRKIADLDPGPAGDYYGWRRWERVFAYSPR